MKNIFEHPIVRNIISFLISIIIVLILFVGIVGILLPMILEAQFEHVKVISLICSLIGALIIMLARRWQIMRFVSFVKKPGDFVLKNYDYIGSLIIGAAFLSGGIIYMRSKNPIMFFIPFVAGFALIRIFIFIINKKIKEKNSVLTRLKEAAKRSSLNE